MLVAFNPHIVWKACRSADRQELKKLEWQGCPRSFKRGNDGLFIPMPEKEKTTLKL
ncbi:hypothetical protein ACLEJQ_24225 [Pseudomonas sp. SMV71]|uniref:hypothetical protein n=1 Tax=unclassified Pseudomonas TaxID=196821 RepID=UPI003F833411